jgi:hypothetical protein
MRPVEYSRLSMAFLAMAQQSDRDVRARWLKLAEVSLKLVATNGNQKKVRREMIAGAVELDATAVPVIGQKGRLDALDPFKRRRIYG